MSENQFFAFIKKPVFILAIILIAFFLKGVFLATLFPIFTGQDEARHYNSLQYINEPVEKTWPMTKRQSKTGNDNFEDYNFSQEIIEAGKAADINVFRHELYDTVNFSQGSYDGKNETLINEKLWKPYNFYTPPDAGGHSLYHILGAKIEKTLSGSNILVRFFSNRLFSVLLGTLGILLAYLIAKNIGMKQKESLILAAIIAFQPKYAMYSTNINYDVLLIPLFFLFTLGGILSLKNGLNWKNGALMCLAVISGIFTKETALILLLMFIFTLGFHSLKMLRGKMGILKIVLIAAGIIILLLLINTKFKLIGLLPLEKDIPTTINSLGNYLSASLTPGRLALSARTYWGALGWNSDIISDNFTDIIWYIEMIAGIGLVYFLISKKRFKYLPEKKYVIFLFIMVVALQIGIRMADWKVFINTDSLALGTPGRYFLPNLVSHIILLFVGLGALLRKEKYFQNALILGLILMFSFSMYLTFNVIIPRYYL